MVSNEYKYLATARFATVTSWSAVAPIIMPSAFSASHNISLSTIIKRVKDTILIEDKTLYKRITIKQYGQGVTQRDSVLGKDIGTKKQFVASEGQLIISGIDARNGSIGVVPNELSGAIVTNDFWLFDVSEKANTQYLLLLLSSELFQLYWQSKSSGTTNRQRINQNDLLAMEIPLPNLTIQQKIVEKYHSTISKAEENETKAFEYEEMTDKILSEELGIEEIEFAPIKKFSVSRFSLLHNWSASFEYSTKHKSTLFPIYQLSNLCKVNSGGTPSRSNPNYYGGDIPWVKTGEVRNESIFDTEEKITQSALENSSARIYPPESIIVAMYGHTRGKTAKLAINAATNQACAVLHAIDKNKVLTDFLWIYLQGENTRLRALAVGSAQPNLNADMIKKYPVILPSLKIQQKIVDKIFDIKNQIKAYKQNAISLREHAKKKFEEEVFGETKIFMD